MQIDITGHHVDVTPALRAYVTEKLGRLNKYSDRITHIRTILTVEKLMQKAEATVHVSGMDVYADCTADNMYTAIDLLSGKLDRQLIKHKEKQKNHHRP